MADIYDNAFHTVLYDCSRLVLPLINLVFGEDYAGDERIVFRASDLYAGGPVDHGRKRVADSVFTVCGKEEKTYHWECQSGGDSTMLLRLFEYDALIAREGARSADGDADTLVVDLPRTAVLYLRHPKNSRLDSYKYLIRGSGGELLHTVPVIRLDQYTLDDIFEKDLLMLLPFYIFTKEPEFGILETDSKRLEMLVQEYGTIIDRLDAMVEEGKLSDFYRTTLLEASVSVADEIAKKYDKITGEVDKVMYATLIDTKARRIWDEGWDEGHDKGWDEGHDEGWDEGHDEGRDEGRNEAQLRIFRNLIASGMSKEEAQRLTEIRDDLAERAMQPEIRDDLAERAMQPLADGE